MDMEWAEVTHDLLLGFKPNVTEILVSENESTALSSIKCEFIEASRRKLRELHAADFGANVGR